MSSLAPRSFHWLAVFGLLAMPSQELQGTDYRRCHTIMDPIAIQSYFASPFDRMMDWTF